MPDSDDDGDGDDAFSSGILIESDIEALELALEESQRTFDEKLALLNDIDDKALRSVRTAVILAGFALTALGIGGPSAIKEIHWLSLTVASGGVVVLTFAALQGIATYGESDVTYGMGESYRDDVYNGAYTHKEWVVQLLEGYNEWNKEVKNDSTNNFNLLYRTQFALIIGILLYLLAAAMVVLYTLHGLHPAVTLGAVLFLALLSGVWFWMSRTV